MQRQLCIHCNVYFISRQERPDCEIDQKVGNICDQYIGGHDAYMFFVRPNEFTVEILNAHLDMMWNDWGIENNVLWVCRYSIQLGKYLYLCL